MTNQNEIRNITIKTKTKRKNMYKSNYLNNTMKHMFFIRFVASIGFFICLFLLMVPSLFSANQEVYLFPIHDGMNKISSSYGYRKDPATGNQKLHEGIDINTPIGTEVVAVADGQVIFTYSECTHVSNGKPCGHLQYGNHVKIKHGDGRTSIYAHLTQDGAKLVQVGDCVKAGQVIALSGSSGYSTGPHLHFEIRDSNNKTINVNPDTKGGPIHYIDERIPPSVNVAVPQDKKTAKDFDVFVSAADNETSVKSISISVQHESGVFEPVTVTIPVGEKSTEQVSSFKLRDLGNEPGKYIITVTATDEAGNTTTDKQQPVIKEPKGSSYTVRYLQEEGSQKVSQTTTKVTFNKNTQTVKIEKLKDIKKPGYSFKGWHVHRDYDDTWYMKNKNTGKKYWLPIEKEGADFIRCVYKSGLEVSRTAPSGTVDFYGIWTPNKITVQYDSGKIISTQKQKPVYGDGTKVLTAAALGSDFKKTGYTLNGWRVQKDGKWLVRNTSTKKLAWRNSAGFGYTYYKLGLTSGLNTVFKCSENNNTITLVAAWKANRFKIQYYANPKGNSLSGAKNIKGSDQSCVYGSKNKTQTYQDLGITVPKQGYSKFEGWIVVNSAGKIRYKSILGDKALWLDPDTEMIPIGYKIWLYRNGCSVTKTVSSGTVKFYAQFKANDYYLDYYNNGKKVYGSTIHDYGKKYTAKTIAQIEKITTPKGYTFKGWKLQRPDGFYLMKRVSDGKKIWKKLSNNAVPSGYKIYYHKDGFVFSSLTPQNHATVKAIASWTPIKYTIEYGKRNGDGPDTASEKTTVTYNVKHSTRSFKKLGFTPPNNDTKHYEGRWRIYRSDTNKWLCYDTKDQKKVWITEDTYKYNNEQINNHKRYIYYYYKEKQEVSRTVSTPTTVRFVAYWRLKTGLKAGVDSWEKYDNNLKKWRN